MTERPSDEWLRKLVDSDPTATPPHLAVMREGVPYHAGTAVRLPSVTVVPRASGLFAPEGVDASPFDYFGVYLVLEDYFESAVLGDDGASVRSYLIERIVRAATPQRHAEILSIIGMLLRRPDDVQPVIDDLRSALRPAPRARFDNAIAPGPERRVPVARQPVLAALLHVLSVDESAIEDMPVPVEHIELMLTHAIASGLDERPETDETIGGLPASLAVELVCNSVFYESDDLYSKIDRQLRLWRDFGHRGDRYLKGVRPADLVVEATGIEVEDFLSMGFALLAHVLAWQPGKPIYLNADFGGGIRDELVDAFLALVARTGDEMRERLRQRPPRSPWDFLALQERPVLRTPQGLLVLDEAFLTARITSGLYWIVHDHQKAKNETLRLQWTQAWGDIVEAMVEDELRPHAPLVFGAPAQTFFTESDLSAAYGSDKAADVVIDCGIAFVAIEIVSGQLSTGTRIDGDPAAFRSDMEKLVLKKVRQLDATARNLIEDEQPLTGVRGAPRKVFPVVVVGGGSFPLSPVIMSYVEEQRRAEGLLEHALVQPLSVLDLGEVEMLEGLLAEGVGMVDVLSRWRESGISAMGLHNFVLREYPLDPPSRYRPARMKDHVDAAFEDIRRRLNLPDDPDHRPLQ